MQIDACVKLHIVSTQKENPRAGPRYTQLAKVYPGYGPGVALTRTIAFPHLEYGSLCITGRCFRAAVQRVRVCCCHA
jgi:hypothetical protein